MSSVPILFGMQVAIFMTLCRRAGRFGLTTLVVISVFIAWAAASALLALRGVYDSPDFLATLPGLWLPTVPFLIMATLLVFPPVKRMIADVAIGTSDHALIAIQTLRVAAAGTLWKTLQGGFPVHVELAIGVTDLAFGLSAVFLWGWTRTRRLAPGTLILWHLVGVALILVPGNASLQLGLPGPAFLFDRPPTAEVMLDYPMALAPTLVVPIFLLFNLLGAFAAARRTAQPSNRIPS